MIFFFASAGASSAYLTVSEIFPMETRAMAIAFFYAVATGVGGIIGPALYGHNIATGNRTTVFLRLPAGRRPDDRWPASSRSGWASTPSSEQLEDVAEPITAEAT